jgi:hypothetical protein
MLYKEGYSHQLDMHVMQFGHGMFTEPWPIITLQVWAAVIVTFTTGMAAWSVQRWRQRRQFQAKLNNTPVGNSDNSFRVADRKA